MVQFSELVFVVLYATFITPSALGGTIEGQSSASYLKQFLTSPPPIKYILFSETNQAAEDPRRFLPPQLWEGKIGPIPVVQVRLQGGWSEGNFWIRQMGADSAEDAYNDRSGADVVGRSERICWFIAGSTAFKTVIPEETRYDDESLLNTDPVVTTVRGKEINFRRVLNLGLFSVEPGTFSFGGNKFTVNLRGNRTAHGELLEENGIVTRIRYQADGQVVYSIFELTYGDGSEIPAFFPHRITQRVYSNSDEFKRIAFDVVISKLLLSEEPLLAQTFLPESIPVVTNGLRKPLIQAVFTNGDYYWPGPDSIMKPMNNPAHITPTARIAFFVALGGVGLISTLLATGRIKRRTNNKQQKQTS